MPASSWTLWNRLSMIGGPCREAGSCTRVIEAANTSPLDTPNAWRRPASSLRWVASATLTTTLSPKPSTASTRPRSSICVDHGAHARPSSSPRSNGSTGSTIAGCWNPSATSRRPKPRSATTPCWMSQLGPRDSNETASDQPGAVHDWGGALGFDWAYRHQQRVHAVAYMETFVAPLTLDDLPESFHPTLRRAL